MEITNAINAGAKGTRVHENKKPKYNMHRRKKVVDARSQQRRRKENTEKEEEREKCFGAHYLLVESLYV